MSTAAPSETKHDKKRRAECSQDNSSTKGSEIQSKKPKNSNAPSSKSAQQPNVEDDDDDPYSLAKLKKAKEKSKQQQPKMQEFEGKVVGVELFLVEKHSQLAYRSERDEEGNLVLAGKWNAQTKSIDPVPQDSESAPASSSSESSSSSSSNSKQRSSSTSPSPSDEKSSKPPTEPVEFPYPVDDADHCETGADAYRDIEPILAQIAESLGKSKAELRIYDPYFCQGAVVRNLAALGFTNVYNKMEDFYEVVRQGKTPEFDVLLTNPPYSSDHIERILRFCVQSNRPWFLLVPSYVYRKPYYDAVLKEKKPLPAAPIFLTPGHRYAYISPLFLRTELKSKERNTSPFLSFWYIDLGKLNMQVVRWWQQTQMRQAQDDPENHPVLTTQLSKLPVKYMDSFDPVKKRLRKLEKMRQQQQQPVKGSFQPKAK